MITKVIDWSYYTGKVSGYGDCRAVVGEYACLLPDRHVESFLGIAPLPHGQNVNYLRIPRNPGDGRIAGGGQEAPVKDQVLEWQWPAGWVPVGVMWGPNAVIYDYSSRCITLPDRPAYSATGGWRFPKPDNTLVDCISTHDDIPAGIYEWSRHGNVRIGQGADGVAVVAFDGEPLRRLDPRPASERNKPADMRFMHSDQRGDLFGIAICELKGQKTYFVWPTLAELRALPFVTETPVPPIPPVEPPVSNLPDPEAVKARVKIERDKFGATVTQDELGIILNNTCLHFEHTGMHFKLGQAKQPITGTPIDSDIIRYMPPSDPVGWYGDVLGATAVGVGTPQAPNWARGTDGRESFVEPVQTAPGPGPGPGPQPPSGDLEQRVAALEAWRAAVAQVSR